MSTSETDHHTTALRLLQRARKTTRRGPEDEAHEDEAQLAIAAAQVYAILDLADAIRASASS